MKYIRKAIKEDLSRIAEIYVFNNRINYLPIFKDIEYSFGKLQVLSLIDDYFNKKEILDNLYVYDDGIIKGFTQLDGTEIRKLYVDTFFQREGIGGELISYIIDRFKTDCLWALKKNVRAIAFYQKHGFELSGEETFEEGTTEYIVQLVR